MNTRHKKLVNFTRINEVIFWAKEWEISPCQLFTAWRHTHSNEICVLQYWLSTGKLNR